MGDEELTSLSRVTSFKDRKEQLLQWNNSPTDRQSTVKDGEKSKVKFDLGTLFLAACNLNDQEEAEKLLAKGVHINFQDSDGLTGLHNTCIEDNLPMVDYLIKNGAYVNLQDNEGWSPIHATASCGYIDIAKYLIDHGADLALCNTDGELPIDCASSVDMKRLLASAMNEQNIDAEEARGAEARTMYRDAQDWLEHRERPELEDVRNGATALNMAAAKGYHDVMILLLKAGANINHQDFDGWTPLHGAGHWGQAESCKILAEAGCDMRIRDKEGKTAADQADDSLKKLLMELYQKQKESHVYDEKSAPTEVINTRPPSMDVPSSGTSEHRTANVVPADSGQTVSETIKDVYPEGGNISKDMLNSSNSTTEGKDSPNERPLTVREGKPRTPVAVVPPTTSSSPSTNTTNTAETVENDAQQNEVVVSRQDRAGSLPDRLAFCPVTKSSSDSFMPLYGPAASVSRRTTSAPPPQMTMRRASGSDYDIVSSPKVDPTSWRAGLRKTGSTTAVVEVNATDRRPTSTPSVMKSASANAIVSKNSKSNADSESSIATVLPSSGSTLRERRPFAALREQGAAERSSYPLAGGNSNYIPYYKRQQMEREAKRNEERQSASGTATPASLAASATSTRSTDTDPERTERRVSRFDPPKRDEEAETNRKIKAKRARETRRSTQGVTQDDVKAAEATLKIADANGTANKETVSQSGSQPEASSVTQDQKTEEPSRRRAWQRSISYDPPSPLSPSSRTPSSPLYSPRAQDEGSRSSFRKARDTIVSANNNSSSSIPDTLATSSDRRNLRNRRNRRERRSTGVIYYDENELDKDGEDEKDASTELTNDSQNEATTAATATTTATTAGWNATRPFTSRRYGSASDVPSQMSSTSTGRYRRPTSSTSESNTEDYKKLYEETKSENESLKARIQTLLSEAETNRSNNDSSSRSRTSNGESLSDRRERRALERRISELEDEVSKMESIKADNARLKEENGALIRVISKLSK